MSDIKKIEPGVKPEPESALSVPSMLGSEPIEATPMKHAAEKRFRKPNLSADIKPDIKTKIKEVGLLNLLAYFSFSHVG